MGNSGLKPVDSALAKEVLASSSEIQREHLFKVLVIGALGTGKTSIIRRYTDTFSQYYRKTVGVDFARKVIICEDGNIIRLQIWDIDGQTLFRNTTRVYYKEAAGAFIVFDANKSATFDAVMKIKNDIDEKASLPNGSNIPCVLLANKCDLPLEGPVRNSAAMEEFCRKNGFLSWFLVSAKNNRNIDDAANLLMREMFGCFNGGKLLRLPNNLELGGRHVENCEGRNAVINRERIKSKLPSVKTDNHPVVEGKFIPGEEKLSQNTTTDKDPFYFSKEIGTTASNICPLQPQSPHGKVENEVCGKCIIGECSVFGNEKCSCGECSILGNEMCSSGECAVLGNEKCVPEECYVVVNEKCSRGECSVLGNEKCSSGECAVLGNEKCSSGECSVLGNEKCVLEDCYVVINENCSRGECSVSGNEKCLLGECSVLGNEKCILGECSVLGNEKCPPIVSFVLGNEKCSPGECFVLGFEKCSSKCNKNSNVD